ncbi:6-phospho-beta-glucosidase [Aeromicrobium sp. Root236]|uniref:6-phospho-beta-glucosidase n=1 Tax=Aeromicrobium sp. Root236 TaxID=1736498 RepID=UPI0007016606|nr:6-phospho-beta-glucosidase [Aeromicrobium sp. Root236]KRC65861.1 6-phospho-beta-glucosidase [Aeromicrobium sp. Root236]
MQLTVLGGGGFRVPLVYRALLSDDSDSRVNELVLYDVDPARLRRVGEVLARLEAEAGVAGPAIRLETDLAEAVRGTDFVFSAIRVGGLEGRVCDERAALDEGVLGQETTGAGGVCYGLRTVPVAVQIARTVKEHAPDAYVINFTNPAGMVTEAMSAILGDRVVGICDSPVGMFKRVARALDLDRSSAVFDYAGLNHLGWLRRVLVDGVDVLPGLLADPDKLLTIEEGRLFGPTWLRTIGAVPNEYLWYWYYTKDAIAGIEAAKETRGEFLLRQQGGFYAGGEGAGDAYAAWDRTRRDREESYMADSRDVTGAGERDEDDLDGGGYDRVALELMHAIARNQEATLVLNVRNGSTLPGLPADAVIEVPCVVDANGPRALPLDPLAPHAAALVATVKDVERTAIEAATTASRELAVRALALHPLVDSVNTARRIFDRQLQDVPDLSRVFG